MMAFSAKPVRNRSLFCSGSRWCLFDTVYALWVAAVVTSTASFKRYCVWIRGTPGFWDGRHGVGVAACVIQRWPWLRCKTCWHRTVGIRRVNVGGTPDKYRCWAGTWWVASIRRVQCSGPANKDRVWSGAPERIRFGIFDDRIGLHQRKHPVITLSTKERVLPGNTLQSQQRVGLLNSPRPQDRLWG